MTNHPNRSKKENNEMTTINQARPGTKTWHQQYRGARHLRETCIDAEHRPCLRYRLQKGMAR
jgi:hypothetical protein